MKHLFLSLFLFSTLSACSATQRGAIEDARSASCHVARRVCTAVVSACDATEPPAEEAE